MIDNLFCFFNYCRNIHNSGNRAVALVFLQSFNIQCIELKRKIFHFTNFQVYGFLYILRRIFRK